MNEKTPHAPGTMGDVVDGKPKTDPVTPPMAQPVKPAILHSTVPPTPAAAPAKKI